jgi:hypothetical protein
LTLVVEIANTGKTPRSISVGYLTYHGLSSDHVIPPGYSLEVRLSVDAPLMIYENPATENEVTG